MTFGTVPATEWQLKQNITGSRRKRLLQTSFHRIVQRITDEAELQGYGRQKIKRFPGSKRVWINLILPCEIVDCFHNGAGGYRAQYYVSMDQGKAADRYIIDSLLWKLRELCKVRPKRGCVWDFIEASLCDPDAKVWIHQGTWMWQKKLADRNLSVDRWTKNGSTMSLRKKLIPTWARLTPDNETGLCLKGGCVNETFHPIGAQLKPYRSHELHNLGYT